MSLFQMSCNGAVMIAAIIVIRTLAINRLPKTAFFLLWNVTLVRLLIPFSLPSQFSIYTLLEKLLNAKPKEAVSITSRAIQTTAGGTGATEPFPWMFAIWLLGAIVLAGYHGMVYWKCKRQFDEALPVKNNFVAQWLEENPCRRNIAIRQSDRISAPLTYGILKPVILVPKKMPWEDSNAVDCILQHELTHIRRLDALAKLLLIAVLCIHWFNPFVWMMVVLANQDLELSCDEAVIQRMGEKMKASYALTLINMEERKCGLTPMCSHFSNNSIEERIVLIMNMKKTSLLGIVLTAALVVGTTTAFATSAKSTPTDSIPAAKLTAASRIDDSDDANTVAVPKSSIPAIEVVPANSGETDVEILDVDLVAGDYENALPFEMGDPMTVDSFTKWMAKQEAELNADVAAGKISKADAQKEIESNQQVLQNIKKGDKVYMTTIDGEDVLITMMNAINATVAVAG